MTLQEALPHLGEVQLCPAGLLPQCFMHVAISAVPMPHFAFHLYHLLQQVLCGMQGASYWAALLSIDRQEVRYCNVHKQCDNRAKPRSLQWQPVYVQCAPLLADAGTGQLLCNVLQRHMQSNVRQCSPCTAHQQKKMAEGKTTARPEAMIYDTIQAVRLPVVLVVSVWSLQASSSCVHCEHFSSF